jgi:hypothetical protein
VAPPLHEDRSSSRDIERVASEVFGVETVRGLLAAAGILAEGGF